MCSAWVACRSASPKTSFHTRREGSGGVRPADLTAADGGRSVRACTTEMSAAHYAQPHSFLSCTSSHSSPAASRALRSAAPHGSLPTYESRSRLLSCTRGMEGCVGSPFAELRCLQASFATQSAPASGWERDVRSADLTAADGGRSGRACATDMNAAYGAPPHSCLSCTPAHSSPAASRALRSAAPSMPSRLV
jgi:hypothetical protein